MQTEKETRKRKKHYEEALTPQEAQGQTPGSSWGQHIFADSQK